MANQLDLKGFIDIVNPANPDFRLIFNIPQNMISQQAYPNIFTRLNELSGVCFGNVLNITCPDPNNCPRLIFIGDMSIIENNIPQTYPDQQTLDTVINGYKNQEGLMQLLNYFNRNENVNQIKSYLTVNEYPTFNEIYNVCTAQESRRRGYTSNLLTYYRETYGNKSAWIGVQLNNNFPSQEDFNRSFQNWITETGFSFRNNSQRQLILANQPIPQQDIEYTRRNLLRLFKLQEKYWKKVADLYINNGFTEIIISDKTPSGNRGSENFFLSLFLDPNLSLNANRIPIMERIEKGKDWVLKSMNNYNLVFRPSVQEFFNRIYEENQAEEVSGSLFVDDIEFDNENNAVFTLRCQNDVFLGFEVQNHAYSTVKEATRFGWHLHPAGAYVHFNKPTGEPSGPDILHQINHIKKLNFFEIVFSREGFYFYKASPAVQTLILSLDNNIRKEIVTNFFSEVINALNVQVLGIAEQNVNLRIATYLQIMNNVNIRERMTEGLKNQIKAILSPDQGQLLEMIYISNCKIFEVVYIHEFPTLNNRIIQIYRETNYLHTFLDRITNLLSNNYYEQSEVDNLVNQIEEDIKSNDGLFFDNLENPEGEWSRVRNFEGELNNSDDMDRNDLLSRIFSDREKIYNAYRFDNFINYAPPNTFAGSTL